ncbi:MAG: hypothetical protein R3C97_12435 [Geminicoccaceae bacterium]
MRQHRGTLPIGGLLLGILLAIAPTAQALPGTTVEGLATVTDDGRIAMDGHVFRLHGIELAMLGRDCRTTRRPVRCGERSVLVLRDLVNGFVHCRPTGADAAICTIAGKRMFDDRIDLAERLLIEGFAFAEENAPARYRRLERVAQSRKSGLWGNDFIDIR